MSTDPSATAMQYIKHKRTLNVVFSDNTYDTMTRLLSRSEQNCDEDVAIFAGGFHIGPIDSDGDQVREKWLKDHLGPNSVENFFPTTGNSYASVDRSLAAQDRVYAWIDITSAAEYANFLCWVDRFEPSSFFIVKPKPYSDMVWDSDGTPSLDSFRNGAQLASSDELNEYAILWNKLKLENAAFRLFAQTGEFRSFAIDAFDDVLVHSIDADWQPMPKIVLKAITTCWSSGQSVPGDLFFYRRLIWMSENLKLELRGESNNFSDLELRTKS